MNILSIESSCDETSAAIIKNGTEILSNVIVSQIDIFAAYGGVIPEVAARSHLEAILPVIDQAFKDANFLTSDSKPDWSKIDAIAVTHTPGLLGSLLIGTLTARTLAILHNKPLYPVHHLKSHIYSTWLKTNNQKPEKQELREGGVSENFVNPALKSQHSRLEHSKVRGAEPPECCNFNHDDRQVFANSPFPEFPLLALVISGGHTQIIHMPSHNHFEIIGTTLDDAVGECFDKVAKILGLPYPGGPAIREAAKTGNKEKYHFPHPKVAGLDFSFSGLKTAVLRECQKIAGVDINFPSHLLKDHLKTEQKADIAASFESTTAAILAEKLLTAFEIYPKNSIKSLVVAGGVSANQQLKTTLYTANLPIDPNQIFFPAPGLTGDNAAMVGTAAYFEIKTNAQAVNPYHLDIFPRSNIEA